MLRLTDIVPRLNDISFKKPINWTINGGEHWVIIGPNGAGKTLLIDIMTGRYALKSGTISYSDENGNELRISDAVKTVSFRDIYSLVDIQNSYYQQRWNVGDSHDVATVKDLFKDADLEYLYFLISFFRIEDLIDKEINLLSSGELRKFLIIRSLLRKPKILVLDNPFIGLDTSSRKVLSEMFEQLIALKKIQLIWVLSAPDDIPKVATHVLAINNKQIEASLSVEDFVNNKELHTFLFPSYSANPIFPGNSISEHNFENTLIFNNVSIKYGKRIILNNLSWKVRKGEKWALLGENGSGKSTLLSLVAADNPQAYANDITLFDRKRGTGESIWDIKKRIGYISPEMHLYYQKNVPAIDVVGSGFFDTIGLYRKCNKEQEKVAEQWMDIFRVKQLKNTPFLLLSSGEQRLVLLARVFVKKPDLLILDEPLHGLDVSNKLWVKQVVEEFCDKNKSLIYVTHYENEIPSIVDKRLVLNKYRNV